jgi:hypothetical protein
MKRNTITGIPNPESCNRRALPLGSENDRPGARGRPLDVRYRVVPDRPADHPPPARQRTTRDGERGLTLRPTLRPA